MSNIRIFLFSLASVLLVSCSVGQKKSETYLLSPEEFIKIMNEFPSAPVLDVRTPEEFEGGYIKRAVNLDWNGSGFDEGTARLDKTKPVFVYCLSGGRSGSAASKMRRDGFAKVYELDGGMMKWRSAGLPEENPGNALGPKGMQTADFEKLLKTDKTVLVDFYADWCGPCKKMKPDLDRLAAERKENLVVLRIDADANPDLSNALDVQGLPSLFVYRNQMLVKKAEGYQKKEELEKLVSQ